MSPKSKGTLLKHAIIDTYREELRLRYLPENCRRFKELQPISDEKLHALRDYFLECIYPASDDRDRLDDAFDRMGEIIRSPRRLMPLMTLAFKTVWKLGRKFPHAVSAGKNTLEAYLETRKIEAKLMEFALENRITPDEVAQHDIMVQMVAHVPEQVFITFRSEILRLFGHLSDVGLIAATVEIMDSSKSFMESRPDLYHEEELAGFSLGHQVLERGLALFRTMKDSEFPAVLKGIEVVENDWYDRVKAEAAAIAAGA